MQYASTLQPLHITIVEIWCSWCTIIFEPKTQITAQCTLYIPSHPALRYGEGESVHSNGICILVS